MKKLFRPIFFVVLIIVVIFFVLVAKKADTNLTNIYEKKQSTIEEGNNRKSKTNENEIADNTFRTKVYGNAHDMLLNLNSYETMATVKYISNKTDNEYLTNQKARKTGEYKIEVISPEKISGTITIFDGDMIYQYNPKNGGEVFMTTSDTIERSSLFLTDFIKNYMTSLDSAVQVGTFKGGKSTIFETIIPGGNDHFAKQKLYVNSETLQPEKLTLNNKDGVELIIVEYRDFEYNKEFVDEEFKVGK